MTLQNGETFDHYKITTHMAQGGTGDVYRAVDMNTGSEVALKIPMRETVLDPARYELFLRELEALRVLDHPAVQHFVESGRQGSTPYLVTELVSGRSLRSILKECGFLSPDRALALTRRIAVGLLYCHSLNVVHRDLKPDNIYITGNDQPVILDFGLALTPARPGAGKATGTIDYVSPEQIRGQRGDKRTDIYGLGMTLYEMLAGQPPYISDDPEDPTDLLNKHLYAAVPRLDQINPGISPQVATLVARCIQRDPDGRYDDMEALIHDLDHLESIDSSALEDLTTAP
ncbi:MAG TPA: serine/threonine-protein kinase, partial [Aggregatilineales bacterium]|nr:serine/threonine-protein kinase [Aggregatilineales bacterium]